MDIEIHDNTYADYFCHIFQHLKLFSDHINLMFDNDKLYVQTMDSSHITIGEITLNKEWFGTYNYKSNKEQIVLGVSSSVFYKVMNTREKNQVLCLNYDEDQTDRLFVHFKNKDNTTFGKHFELPLMDIETDVLEIPDFDSNIKIKMPSVKFASLIQQLQIFGDSIDFNCMTDKIQLSSNTTENGKMEVDIDNSMLDTYELEDDNELKLSFTLSKMHDICLYSKISKEIIIILTENYPIKIIYSVGENHGKMTFYLAPKFNEN